MFNMSSAAIGAVVLLILILLYYYKNIEGYQNNSFVRRYTNSNQIKYPIPNNRLVPTDTMWEAPNMVNFDQFMNNLETITKRRPKWFPNEETFKVAMEGYRPGDGNINGYVTAMAMNRIKKQ